MGTPTAALRPPTTAVPRQPPNRPPPTHPRGGQPQPDPQPQPVPPDLQSHLPLPLLPPPLPPPLQPPLAEEWARSMQAADLGRDDMAALLATPRRYWFGRWVANSCHVDAALAAWWALREHLAACGRGACLEWPSQHPDLAAALKEWHRAMCAVRQNGLSGDQAFALLADIDAARSVVRYHLLKTARGRARGTDVERSEMRLPGNVALRLHQLLSHPTAAGRHALLARKSEVRCCKCKKGDGRPPLHRCMVALSGQEVERFEGDAWGAFLAGIDVVIAAGLCVEGEAVRCEHCHASGTQQQCVGVPNFASMHDLQTFVALELPERMPADPAQPAGRQRSYRLDVRADEHRSVTLPVAGRRVEVAFVLHLMLLYDGGHYVTVMRDDRDSSRWLEVDGMHAGGSGQAVTLAPWYQYLVTKWWPAVMIYRRVEQ